MAAVKPFLNAAAQAAEPIMETETSATTLPNASTLSSSGSVPTYEGIMSSKVPSVTGPHPSSLVPPGVGLQDVATHYSRQCFLPLQQAETSSPPAFLFSSSSETAHAVEPEAPEPELAEEIDQNVIWNALDLDILAEPEEGEEISQPTTQDTPAGVTDDEERRLLASPEYKSIERNRACCERQVQLIVAKAQKVLENREIQIRDPEDVRRGVDIALTDIWEREPTERLKALRYIVSAKANPKSRIWRNIIAEIEKQGQDPF